MYTVETMSEEFEAKEQKRLADKKRKREKQKAAGGGDNKSNASTWKNVSNNTSIYLTGLPSDVTVDELYEFAKKGGIILEDDTGKKRIKLYLDDNGKPKGDATVKYAMPESVDLAITLLDQSVFRYPKPPPPGTKSNNEEKPCIVTVQKAEFTQKEKTNHPSSSSSSSSSSAFDPSSSSSFSKKPKTSGSGGLNSVEIARAKLRESLSWDDDPTHSSKLKIVILKPLFSPTLALADPRGEAAYYDELKEEIREEIENRIGGGEKGAALRGGRGAIEKLTVFEGNDEGPVAVKFRDSQHAAQCLQLMNGRWFGGARVTAFYYDGKTNYVVKKKEEQPEDEEKRLKEFGDWLEGNHQQE